MNQAITRTKEVGKLLRTTVTLARDLNPSALTSAKEDTHIDYRQGTSSLVEQFRREIHLYQSAMELIPFSKSPVRKRSSKKNRKGAAQ